MFLFCFMYCFFFASWYLENRFEILWDEMQHNIFLSLISIFPFSCFIAALFGWFQIFLLACLFFSGFMSCYHEILKLCLCSPIMLVLEWELESVSANTAHCLSFLQIIGHGHYWNSLMWLDIACYCDTKSIFSRGF